jgi:hypothetical protein
MLSTLEEGKEADGGISGTKTSLKDRFKLLRMREEAGVSLVTAEDEQTAVKADAQTSPGTTSEEFAIVQTPLSPVPTSPDPGLAPGTASGVNAGVSAMSDVPVDWDLWQSVVYEGPAAVARTSADELNKAIATGIPNAIRGVIWQVLAQSKNDELEMVYRDLVVRGTDKEKKRNSSATSASTTSNGNLSIKEPSSSASSVHSDHSGPNGTAEKDSTTPEQKKKDLAMVQKLEKTIRRDLGARTSYSKYAAAAGLQDGLFGVCKAYALFDEGVGYAQGMNFLVMPILFNVSLLRGINKQNYVLTKKSRL